ncbi:hypothetical protein M0R04_04830 [Candidatus Dojkabacteria bacterium]|nr:hypothetical protein [Candidatus Dojkabacteria bacterium]
MSRTFLDKNGGYRTTRAGIEKKAHDAWVEKSSWGLSRDDLIRLSYFHGDLENGSDGTGAVNGSNDHIHDVVYVSPSGGSLTRYMLSSLLSHCDAFMYGYITCASELK